MRDLKVNEIQTISGGNGTVNLALVGGIIAGAERADFDKTINYCAVYGFLEGLALYKTSSDQVGGAVALLVIPPVAAVLEAGIGWIGYSIGNYFSNPK